MELTRRELIRSGAGAAGAIAFGPGFLKRALAAPATAGASPYGALQAANSDSLMLPAGFTSREIARGVQPVGGTGYLLPPAPDGQATFRTRDGGWILVTNSETVVPMAGSSGIRFSASGDVVDAYRILGGTNVNCAGGPTPWGTWLSGEETDGGMIWEADPTGVLAAEPRPALGVFAHEAAAVDPVEGRVYLTEDHPNGGFYRFTPARYPDLSRGLLEVAKVSPRRLVSWAKVPDPSTAVSGSPTRLQVAGKTRFNGGEGIWYSRGVLYWTTKGDKRVWAHRPATRRLEILFDRGRAPDSSLDAVDNVTVSSVGDVLVCEDGGNLEIGLITSERRVSPLLRFVGPDHAGSEVCGVVFSPAGDRLYCTSQRAYPALGPLAPGAIYEIKGPFRRPRTGVPRDFVFGPPAGELRPQGPLNPGSDRRAPVARVQVPARVARARYLRNGIAVKVFSPEAGTVSGVHKSHGLSQKPGLGGSSPRPDAVVLGRARSTVERGTSVTLRIRIGRRARRLLAAKRAPVDTRLLVSVVDGAGNERTLTKPVRIGRAASG